VHLLLDYLKKVQIDLDNSLDGKLLKITWRRRKSRLKNCLKLHIIKYFKNTNRNKEIMATEDKIVRTSEIKLNIGLNENNLPLGIKWSATDGAIENTDAKAMMLSLWDPKENNTMKIDLWTKDMSVEEMKQFFHQTLLTMADTFERATGEKNICEDLRDYCYHFADKMNILPEE